jgi:hypothetical protein
VNTHGSQRLRKGIAIAAVLLLAGHGLLCIYFAVTPRSYKFHRTPLGSLYHRVFLIGPFFAEQRIASSTHLYMRYKVMNGSWSEPASYTDRAHRKGISIVFQYNDYKHDDLLRYFARSYRSHKTDVKKTNEQICILCRYGINELIPPEQAVDSINLLFIHNTFVQKNAPPAPDTVWNVALNPERCVVR